MFRNIKSRIGRYYESFCEFVRSEDVPETNKICGILLGFFFGGLVISGVGMKTIDYFHKRAYEKKMEQAHQITKLEKETCLTLENKLREVFDTNLNWIFDINELRQMLKNNSSYEELLDSYERDLGKSKKIEEMNGYSWPRKVNDPIRVYDPNLNRFKKQVRSKDRSLFSDTYHDLSEDTEIRQVGRWIYIPKNKAEEILRRK